MFKDKLEGYKKFYQIVKTIKMVNLAKFSLAIPRTKTRDYTLRYSDKAFGYTMETEEEMIKKATKPLVYVPIFTNRGSCGPLNSATIRYLDSINSNNAKFVVVGKKGNDSMSKLFPHEFQWGIINDMKQAQHFAFASYVFENAQLIESERMQVIYNRYISAGTQRPHYYNIPTFDKWMDKMTEASNGDKEKDRCQFANAVLENDEQVVRDFYQFHGCLVTLNAVCENELSEYAARLVAVEGQLTNINQLMQRTLYVYNKTRQSSITAALIEILSAISAMEGNASQGVKKTNFWSASA